MKRPTRGGNQPAQYWPSVGLIIGEGTGIALSVAFRNVALGLALGAAIGLVIGMALSAQSRR